MNFESLNLFLIGITPADKFASEIRTEIEDFKKKSKIKGTSRPVYLYGGKEKIEIGRTEVLTICDGFLNDDLSKWHVYYICDALLMSELVFFTDEIVEDAVSIMTDPEINGEIDKEVVERIKKTLLTKK
jgi:hypothetical protein